MKSMFKLLGLVAYATAMSFGATTASATLILPGITGCAASGATGTNGEQAAHCVDPVYNVFDDDTTDDGAGLFVKKFSNTAGALTFALSASFGANETFTLTLLNNTANPIGLQKDTVMFFGGLQFDDGQILTGFTDIKLTTSNATKGITDVTATHLDQMFDEKVLFGVNKEGSFFGLDFSNDAVPVPGRTTVVLTGTMVKSVPEPGSLALLGAVLLAFGVVGIKRRASR